MSCHLLFQLLSRPVFVYFIITETQEEEKGEEEEAVVKKPPVMFALDLHTNM